MEYLLKASGIVLVLFLFYTIFLKNETFFKSIRSFFIIGLIIVLAIPLIEIPIYVEAITTQLNLLNYEEIISSTSLQPTIDWNQIILFVYLAGVTFFSVKFLIQLISLGSLVSKHQLTKQGNFYFIETSKNISPFSFFNIIIYNKSQFTIDELEQIINHEKAHVQQWHSIDTILAHLLVITLWFNPFVWLYKKAVQQNLEFLADAYALELANNQKLYQFTLLKTCNATYCTALTNNFYNSLIKKRILMLHKNRSQNKSQWKYLMLLPLLVAFVLTFNTKIIAQEKKLIEFEEVNDLTVDLVIDKNSTDNHFKKEATFFKKEFDITLTFKGIKRNTDNEITAIKINAKGKGLKAKFENAGSNPINPIKISYSSDNNSLNISNIGEIHQNHYSYTIHDTDGKHLIEKHGKKGSFVFVTSDGKVHKGDNSHNVFIKEIESNHGATKIWVSSKSKGKGGNATVKVIKIEDGKYEVKVIEEVHELSEIHELNEIHELKEIHEGEELHEIHIIKEGKGENVFIIKSDDHSMNKHKISKKGDFIFISSENENPLYILNGKEISSEEMKKIKSETIDKIEIIKGKAAIDKYGDKAKDGVMLITTKKN